MTWRLPAIFLCSLAATLQADTIDNSFQPRILGPANIDDVHVDSLGRVYVTGDLYSLNGSSLSNKNFVRLSASGNWDDSFVPNISSNTAVTRIVPLNDGRICILGTFTSVGGASRPGIAILKSDGSLDTTFIPRIQYPASFGPPTYAARDANGRILITYRRAPSSNGSIGPIIQRLLANGAPDVSFQSSSAAISPTLFPSTVEADFVAPLPSGKILLTGNFMTYSGSSAPYAVRLNSSGSRDSTWTSPLTRYSDSDLEYDGSASVGVATGSILADGGFLLGGGFTVGGSPSKKGLIKLNSDFAYSVPTSFPDSSGRQQHPKITHVAADSSGRSVIVGNFKITDSIIDAAILTASGYPIGNSSLPFTGSDPVSRRADGYTVLGHNAPFVSKGYLQPSVQAYSADGTLNRDWAPRILGIAQPSSFAVRPGNGVIAAEKWISTIDNEPALGLHALNENGGIDSSFYCDVHPSNGVSFVLPLPGKRYLIGGCFDSVRGTSTQNLALVDDAGELIRGFYVGNSYPNASSVDSAYLLPDGKVLICGSFSHVDYQQTRNLALLDPATSDGHFVDRAFVCNYSDIGPVTVAVGLPDGGIAIGGPFAYHDGVNGLLKLTRAGTIDFGFRPLVGMSHPSVRDLAVDAAGRILAAGTFPIRVESVRHLLRILPDGSIDPTFTDSALTDVRAVQVQTDGRIYVAGTFTGASKIKGNVVRLGEDGTPDVSLNLALTGVEGFTLAPPARIYLRGTFPSLKSQIPSGLIAATLSSPIPPSITLVPARTSVPWGGSVTLSGITNGSAESYFWLKDGKRIAGEVDASLTLNAISKKDEGLYTLVAGNSAGSVTVSAAVEVVGDDPPTTPSPTPAATPSPTPENIDLVPPRLTVTGPASRTTNLPVLVLNGSARDNRAIHSVEIKVAGKPWQKLSGRGFWYAMVDIHPGKNVFLFRATDTSGNRSDVKKVTVTGSGS